MLSKEKFCELMDEFEEQYRSCEKWLNELHKALGNIEVFYQHDFFNMAIKIMESAMDMDYNNNRRISDTWIGWWILENDWGKKEMDVNIDNKSFIPKTSADLYDIIIDLHENVEEENKSNE